MSTVFNHVSVLMYIFPSRASSDRPCILKAVLKETSYRYVYDFSFQKRSVILLNAVFITLIYNSFLPLRLKLDDGSTSFIPNLVGPISVLRSSTSRWRELSQGRSKHSVLVDVLCWPSIAPWTLSARTAYFLPEYNENGFYWTNYVFNTNVTTQYKCLKRIYLLCLIMN